MCKVKVFLYTGRALEALRRQGELVAINTSKLDKKTNIFKAILRILPEEIVE